MCPAIIIYEDFVSCAPHLNEEAISKAAGDQGTEFLLMPSAYAMGRPPAKVDHKDLLQLRTHNQRANYALIGNKGI